jgi:Yip1 domain
MPEVRDSVPAQARPSQGLVARVVGVLISPRATYAEVAANPKWFGVLAITLLVTAASAAALLSTEVGQRAWLDQQANVRQLNDVQYAQMERIAPFVGIVGAVSVFFFIPIVLLIISGLAYGVFAVLGGDATFKQVFAIVAHSGVITMVATLFSVPIEYARETLTTPANLGVFLPFLEENTFLANLFGTIDLFQIWAIVSMAIGLGVLYKRRTGPVAVGMIAVYLVIVVGVAALRSALSGA